MRLWIQKKYRYFLLFVVNTGLQTLQGSILSLQASFVSVHDPPGLHFKPLKLLNFDSNTDPKPAFHLNEDPDPNVHSNADPDPQPWWYGSDLASGSVNRIRSGPTTLLHDRLNCLGLDLGSGSGKRIQILSYQISAHWPELPRLGRRGPCLDRLTRMVRLCSQMSRRGFRQSATKRPAPTITFEKRWLPVNKYISTENFSKKFDF
jgi:hypothetical protein